MFRALRTWGIAVPFVFIVLNAIIQEAYSAEFTVLQGWLMDEICLEAKKTPCPLNEYAKDRLVLLTPDDKIYRLQKNGVEEWKLQKAYGQLIGVKGLRDDDVIKVTNIVQVTGDKKLTKA